MAGARGASGCLFLTEDRVVVCCAGLLICRRQHVLYHILVRLGSTWLLSYKSDFRGVVPLFLLQTITSSTTG